MGRVPLAMALTMALVASGLDAQTRVGAKVGLSGATIQADENVEAWRLGLTGGVFLEVPLTGWLSAQPEVLYTQKGADVGDFTFVGDPPTISSYVETWRLDYLHFALLAKLSVSDFASGGGIRFLVGPVVSTLLKADRERADGGTADLDGLRSTDLAVAAGIVFELDRAFGEIRYEGLGLDQFAEPSADRLHHHYVAVLIGLRIV